MERLGAQDKQLSELMAQLKRAEYRAHEERIKHVEQPMQIKLSHFTTFKLLPKIEQQVMGNLQDRELVAVLLQKYHELLKAHVRDSSHCNTHASLAVNG